MKTKKAHDYSKYRFDGQLYGKSNLVLAIIMKHLENHPNATMKELQEAFPKESIETFGKARKRSETYKRFFLENVLVTADKKIVVSNQWGKNNISKFLDAAKSNGYKIRHVEKQVAA